MHSDPVYAPRLTCTSQSFSEDESNSPHTSPLPDFPSPFDDDASVFDDDRSSFPNSAGPHSYIPQSEAESGEQLFPGSPLSLVQALVILGSWFSSFPGISKAAFSKLLYLLHTFLLPRGNRLPVSYDALVALLNAFLIPVHDYHCCVNDCVIYRNEHEHLIHCPVS